MMWRTHVLFGINTLWLLVPMPPEILQANVGVLAAVAALGALMPDLDASESKIKHLKVPNTQIRPFLLPALIVSRSEQHRGLMHSFVGWGMAAFCATLLMPIIGWAPVFAFVLGYGSHLFADALTKSGILLFYPKKEWFYVLPKALRFTTGSMAEEVLFASLAPWTLLILLTALHP